MYQEKNDLIRQNRQLDEKIKRQNKTNREKNNINYENGKRLIDLESKLKEIEDYKNERDEFLKNVERKKKAKKTMTKSEKIKKIKLKN